MKKVFSLGLLIAAMVLVTFSSCKPANTVKNVTGVKLSETTKSIVVGGEFVLTATVSPTDAANKEVTWSTDKADIATVDNNGKVKGVKEGEATITVTTKDGNKTDKCKVTVTKKPIAVTGVELNETEKKLKVGEEFTLTATVSPADATNKEVTWTSDKPAVATVDNGKVKAVATGEATITVTTKDGNKTATCKVKVSNTDEAIILGNVGYLEDAVDGAYLYDLRLVYPADAFNDEGQVQKEGTLYVFTINSTKPATPTSNPAMGNYVAKAGTAPMTIMMGKNWANSEYSYAQSFNAQGYLTGEKKPIKAGGTLTLAANKVSFKGETDYGKADLEAEGELKTVANGPWRFEPKAVSTQTNKFTKGTITSYEMDNSLDLYMVCNQDGKILIADFFIAKGSTSFTFGKYDVEKKYGAQAVGTIQKSQGAAVSALWQMASLYGLVQGTSVKTIYFFDNGSAVVSDQKVEFDVKSHFGSSLKITYEGPLTIKKGSVAAAKARARGLSPLKQGKGISF